jgi:hypothetical protein
MNFLTIKLFIEKLDQIFKTFIRTKIDDFVKKWEPTNFVGYHIDIAS